VRNLKQAIDPPAEVEWINGVIVDNSPVIVIKSFGFPDLLSRLGRRRRAAAVPDTAW